MDRTLVERARDGDHEAFAALAGAAVDRLYATASLILRDDDRANDAVQDALIAAWRGIRALREPDAWNAWLHRLLVRACYRLAGRERTSPVVELRLLDEQPSDGADVANRVVDRDQLDRGFRRLPVDQRAVLVLHHYLGLSLVEAAAILGIPTGTAKSRLHRATEAMRAALEADARATVVVLEEHSL
ncbi:MAG TPA: RNA polymerase sigma factor [Candidatus Deferrimicrobiaceae bacterium]|nr:RNA polymerase sigma factor [Candidatus Deferrimicrobiaceae bacterium]